MNAQSIFQTDFENSEGYTLDTLYNQLGWSSSNLVVVDNTDPFSGDNLVWLPLDPSNEGNQVSHTFANVLDEKIVYVDFYLSPNAATSFQDLPDISSQPTAALSGLVNRGNGLGEWAVAYGDGSGNGVWLSTSSFIQLQGNVTPEYLWYVYKLDYIRMVYDFFLNGMLIAEDIPFIDSSLTHFTQFELESDQKQDVYFDKFTVSYNMPVALDHDNDGLLTTVEDTNQNGIVDSSETDFMSPDTDNDAMGDAIEKMHGFDPLVPGTYGAMLDNSSGVLVWKTSFEAGENFLLGNLDGQSLWQADGVVEVAATTSFQGTQSIKLTPDEKPFESFAQHYFGTEGVGQIWISFYGKLSAGMLPGNLDLESSAAGIFKLNEWGNLAAFDGYRGQWLVENSLFNDGYFSDGGWKHYVVHLDYLRRQWTLIAEGGIVFRDILFSSETPIEFSYFKARQLETDAAEPPAYIDNLVVSDTEPEGLDFDFDGIINNDERDFSFLMGLNEYESDSDGDGISDGIEDFDNDGNSNAFEFVNGRLPTISDADVALYADSLLGDDINYNGLSAMPGRPTVAHGPKASIGSTFVAAAESNVILLESGIYAEASLNPNGKNLTLRVNGPVTIR